MERKVWVTILFCLVFFNQILLPLEKIDHRIKDLEGTIRTLRGEERVDALNQLAYEYYRKTQVEKTIQSSKEALSISQQIDYPEGKAMAFKNIGIGYTMLAEFKTAVEYYYQALEVANTLNNDRIKSQILTNIGNIYRVLEQPEKALEYHAQAQKISEKLGDASRSIKTSICIGAAYCDLKKYPQAIEYLNQALKKLKDHPDKKDTANALAWLGFVHKHLRQFPQAMKHMKSALDLFKEIGDLQGEGTTLMDIGAVHLDRGDYEKAEKYLKQGETLLTTHSFKQVLKDCYHYLTLLYEKLNQSDLQLKYYKRYVQMKEQMLAEETTRAIANREKLKELESKDKEVQLLVKEREIQTLKLKQQKVVRNAFIFGFFLLALCLGVLFRKYLYLFAFWKKHKYVGQFRLMDKIGSGGMSNIYLAHNMRDKSKRVAIKLLNEGYQEDQSTLIRFKNEAMITDRLHHSNIIRIIERGEHRNRIFIAMEYLEGITLDQKIFQPESIPLHECLTIMKQISDALAFIHSKRIMHRDLKPANIMLVDRKGQTNFVKLLDFGLSRTKFQTRLTGPGQLVGTVNYMAPELLQDHVSSSNSDVYSLGVIFYELLTGTKLFAASTPTAIMQQILTQPVKPPIELRPEIPPELNQLIMKMLDRDPSQRPIASLVLDSVRPLEMKFRYAEMGHSDPISVEIFHK